MRSLIKSLFVVVSASVFCAASAEAGTIGIKFTGQNNSSLDNSATAGLLPQINWNNEPGKSGSVSNLIDSTGSTTSVNVAWNASATFDAATNEDKTDQFTGQNKILMAGYLDQFNTQSAVVTISGLAPGAHYNVYVYDLPSVNGRGAALDINGGTAQQETAATSSTFIAGNNYLLFNYVTANNLGDLIFNADNPSSASDIYRFAFQGIQLQAVPEPSSIMAFCGLGAMGLMFYVRRRRSA